MLRQFLRAKIHRASITQCDADYVGSITVDADLLAAVDIRPNEAVHVLDIDNGARFETYAIPGKPGSGIIGVNGAAARLVAPGHKVIIVCYGYLEPGEVDSHRAAIALVGDGNRLAQRVESSTRLDDSPEK